MHGRGERRAGRPGSVPCGWPPCAGSHRGRPVTAVQPGTVRLTRPRHPFDGRQLPVLGSMRRHGAAERGFHVPHLRDTTGVGASSTPGTAVLSWPDAVPGQRLPLPSGQSLSPRNLLPSRGYSITGHQRRFTRFTRPACPSPVTPGWDGSPRAFPCAPHPAVTSDARQGGAGHEHAPGTTLPT